jgi:hypothetical protein
MIKETLLNLSLILWSLSIWSQGEIQAVKVKADSLIGDGSRITGITPQNLAVSVSGDTLYITEGNFVIIPGLSV